MTKHYKVIEDVEIEGRLRKAGSHFSFGEDDTPSQKEVAAAIADGKLVNVAAEDVPSDEVELSEQKENTMVDENEKQEGTAEEAQTDTAEQSTGNADESQQDGGAAAASSDSEEESE